MAGCIPVSLPGGNEGRQLAIVQKSAVPTGRHLGSDTGASAVPAKNAVFYLFQPRHKKNDEK
jgi:homoserine kinase